MKRKNGQYIPCLKYSVPIFVEKIYKMQRLEVSGAVRPLQSSLGVKGLISRNLKLQLYNTLIRRTITYASEAWVLKENVTNKVMIYERKILRKIFGPTRTDGWLLGNQ